MAKNKKPKKKTNIRAKKNLMAIKNIQKFMQKFCIGGVMTDPQHTILLKDGVPINRNKVVSDTFNTIRFQWTILIGILCRNPSGELYTKQVMYTTDASIPLLANELNENITVNLRKLWGVVNKDHRLTGYYLCMPCDTCIPDTYAAMLFHKYETPDLIATRYELDYLPDEAVKIYCKRDDGSSKIWQELFVDINFYEEKSFEPVGIKIMRDKSKQPNLKELNQIDNKKENTQNDRKESIIPDFFKRAERAISFTTEPNFCQESDITERSRLFYFPTCSIG